MNPSDDDTAEFGSSASEHPASIGAYRIVRLIARGSVTDLYEAECPKSSHRRYVIKLLRSDSNGSNEWFASVASVMDGLDHPNILPCRSVVSTEEGRYIVMPFVEGRDLLQSVMHGPLEPDQVVQAIDSIARALDYAHGRGVVHGNLHPKHVLLGEDAHIWLIGFAEFTPETPVSILIGNPHHLAPEQIKSNSTVPATDIYALAEVAYLCLCGDFPFAGGTGALAMLQQKQSGPTPSIREWRGDLPRGLDDVLQRGMAIRPEERYSSAGDFSRSLSAVLNQWRNGSGGT